MTSAWTANPVVGDPKQISLGNLNSELSIQTPKRATSPLIDALAGGISGMVGVMAGSPFDVVKARMQNSHIKISAFTVVQKTLQNEGPKLVRILIAQVTAFWKGVTPPLIAEGFLNHIWFGTYAIITTYFNPDPHKEIHFWQAFTAGCIAGGVGAFLVAPTDLIKLQSQVNEGRGSQRKTPGDVVKEIMKRDGLWGFTRGFTAALLRDAPGLGMFFGVYNLIRNFFRQPDGSTSGVGQIMAGGCSGIGSWVISYPYDVIKTRMQVDSRYINIRHCARETFKAEGITVFYRGMVPCLVGSFPINAIIFFIYEILIQASWKMRHCDKCKDVEAPNMCLGSSTCHNEIEFVHMKRISFADIEEELRRKRHKQDPFSEHTLSLAGPTDIEDLNPKRRIECASATLELRTSIFKHQIGAISRVTQDALRGLLIRKPQPMKKKLKAPQSSSASGCFEMGPKLLNELVANFRAGLISLQIDIELLKEKMSIHFLPPRAPKPLFKLPGPVGEIARKWQEKGLFLESAPRLDVECVFDTMSTHGLEKLFADIPFFLDRDTWIEDSSDTDGTYALNDPTFFQDDLDEPQPENATLLKGDPEPEQEPVAPPKEKKKKAPRAKSATNVFIDMKKPVERPTLKERIFRFKTPNALLIHQDSVKPKKQLEVVGFATKKQFLQPSSFDIQLQSWSSEQYFDHFMSDLLSLSVNKIERFSDFVGLKNQTWPFHITPIINEEFISAEQVDPFVHSEEEPPEVPYLPPEGHTDLANPQDLQTKNPAKVLPRERLTLEHLTERMAFHIVNKGFRSLSQIEEASIKSGQFIPPQRLFVALIHLANHHNAFGSVLGSDCGQIELFTQNSDITWKIHKKK